MTSREPTGTITATLVTGASSGIGLELARLAAADGHAVVLVARRADRLQSLAAELHSEHGVIARAVPADLSQPGAVDDVAGVLRAKSIEIDTLVNNAGFGANGAFLANDLPRHLEMIQVNIMAMTQLTHVLVPAMVARRSGRVLNVASIAAFTPGPGNAVYHATKAHILSFSQAIAEELSGTGVTVTALCPGPTETGFSEAAGVTGARLFSGRQLPSAAQVARAGYTGMRRGRRVVVAGSKNKLLSQSVRFIPARLAAKAARRQWEPS